MIILAIAVIVVMWKIVIFAQEEESAILVWRDTTEKQEVFLPIYAKNVLRTANNVQIMLPAQNALIGTSTTTVHRNVRNAKCLHTVCFAQTMEIAVNAILRDTSLRIMSAHHA